MNSSENKPHVINNILVVNLKLLKLVGLWQGNISTQKDSWTIKLYTIYRWALLFIMCLHTATEYLDIVFTWGDLENLAANGSVTLIYTACIMKQTVFLLYEKHLQHLVQTLQSGYLATSLRWTKDHYKILHDADRRAHAASWRYYYLVIATIIAFFTTAILTSYGTAFGLEGFRQGNQTVKTLVFKAWFPFDIQQSGYFEIAFCFQIISCTMGPAINSGMDTFLVSVIINCCGEFKVLKYSLRTIKERAGELLTLEECSTLGNSSAHEEFESEENVRREKTGLSTGKHCDENFLIEHLVEDGTDT
jgi:hypothetical protein